jgi:GAF domain-containing protein/HAMP domain-containing protein
MDPGMVIKKFTDRVLGDDPQEYDQRLFQIHRWLAPVLIATAAISAISYAVISSPNHLLQFRIEILALILAIVVFSPVYFLARAGRLDAAGTAILLGLVVVFTAQELAWEGATILFLVTGLLGILLAGVWLLPRRLRRWLALGGLYITLVIGLSLIHPMHRLAFSGSVLLPLFAPGLSFILAVFLTWQVLRAFQVGSIRNRLLVGFILVTVLPVAITGGIATLITTRDMEARLTNQLESVATLKEAEINNWIENLHLNLSNLQAREDIAQAAVTILQSGEIPDEDFKSSHDAMQNEFINTVQRTQLFDEIFIMNLEGKVLVSSERLQEGKVFFGQPLFEEGLKGRFTAPPLYAPSLGQYRIIATQPLQNPQGKLIGVLAGRAKMESLFNIMLERAGLGETGETYLVGANHVLVTVLRGGQQYLTVRTEGAMVAADQRLSGSSSYMNALQQNVIGVYHWLPELQVALLAEQNRSEALNSILTTLLVSLSIMVTSVLLAVGLALLITRSIANPIASLVRTTARIASGNLSLTAEARRADEVGALARAFNSMALQLREMIGGLEQRVDDRTRELKRRSNQIQAAAEVARDITTTTDLEDVLNQAVNLIRDRFDFYHAGIFLVDERGEYALLRAASGVPGRQMLAQGHKLKVGAEGIVGEVTASKKPHIALDVGSDAVHFKNPWLPETRSEMALPLRVGDRVIGALDVQSTQAAAFDEDDVTILQTMADQLAIAIENARLIQQMDLALRELEHAYGQYTQDAWRNLAQNTGQVTGYRYQGMDIRAVKDLRPEAQETLQSGKPVQKILAPTNGGGQSGSDSIQPLTALAVPIKLRDQVIGVLNLRFQGANIPDETVALVEEAAARLAPVMENSRLLREAQQRAAREQLTGEITGRMRQTLDIDTVLQTATREIFEALGLKDISIHLGMDQDRTD